MVSEFVDSTIVVILLLSERQATKEFHSLDHVRNSFWLPVNVSSSSQNAQAKVNLDSYPKSLLRKRIRFSLKIFLNQLDLFLLIQAY